MKTQGPVSILFFSFFFFSLFSFRPALACDCPPLKSIDSADLSYYHLIFEGVVDSVETGTVHFILNDLYLGSAPRKVPVNFDDSSDCRMSFTKGETWMIYSKYERFGKPAVLFCSRSRKLFGNEKEDFYTATSGNTYLAEKEYLIKNLGRREFVDKKLRDEPGPTNIHPTGRTSILLVVISIPVLLLFYYLFRRFFN